jgi:hypothetical protein
MTRCEKKDRGKQGCVREANHRGRCKVREAPEEAYRTGSDVPGPLRRKGPAGDQGCLDALVAKIEREVAGLVADCGDVVRMLQEDAERSRKRNVLLLKFAVRSRQKIAALKKRVTAARAETRAAVLAAETDAAEDDEGEEEEA